MKKCRRYQLKKIICINIRRGHPWIFRKHLSSAINVFNHGDWLRLVGGKNETIGYGIYDALHPSIKIRLIHIGDDELTIDLLKNKIVKTINKRIHLTFKTNGIRWINGDGDFLPGVIIDQYGPTLVLQVYGSAFLALGRFIACYLKRIQPNSFHPIKYIYFKPPVKIKEVVSKEKWLTKEKGTSVIEINEGQVSYQVNLEFGQKTGGYLDLRGVRRYLSTLDLKGKKVLDLFTGSGSLTMAASIAGAKKIEAFDVSERMVEDNIKYFRLKQLNQCHFINADIFKKKDNFIPARFEKDKYDLIILDPPNLSSDYKNINYLTKTVTELHTSVLKCLKSGGAFLTISCTSRLPLKEYFVAIKKAVDNVFPGERLTSTLIDTEIDHKVKDVFWEGQYLKASFWEFKQKLFPRVEKTND